MTQHLIKLNGIFPPIPTSFGPDGNISAQAITKNLEYWNGFALRGYIVLGSNGEFVMLTEPEKLQVFEVARAAIPSDKLMIAGTGCQSTVETTALTKKAAAIGADLTLVLTPSYYRGRMDKEAMIKHYFTVADSSTVPVLIYNMPACTGIDLSADTIAALSRHSNIVGIKDSGGNIVKMGEVRRLADPGFQILAGSASFLLPALSVGAVGGILAMANIAPGKCLDIYQYFLDGEWEKARDLQVQIIPVNNAITSVWGVPALKAALDMLGLFGGQVRMPLLPLNEEIKRQLRDILHESDII